MQVCMSIETVCYDHLQCCILVRSIKDKTISSTKPTRIKEFDILRSSCIESRYIRTEQFAFCFC